MRSACAAAVPAATLLGAVEAALQLATTLPNKTRRRTWEGAMVKVESEREGGKQRRAKEGTPNNDAKLSRASQCSFVC